MTGHFEEPGGVMFTKAAAFATNTAGTPGRSKGVTTGPGSESVLDAIAGATGPERLDLALRAGPYGDRFGLAPGRLTLAKVKAVPAEIDRRSRGRRDRGDLVLARRFR